MELVLPTIEHKQAALDFLQEHFDNGEVMTIRSAKSAAKTSLPGAATMNCVPTSAARCRP